MKPLVVALGNRWRGDDGVGPRVLDRLRLLDAGLGDDADVAELDGEATRLVDAISDRELVVIVDAVRGAGAPGTVHRLDLDLHHPAPSRPASSHGTGVADAIALGAALGRLPPRVVLVGVEAGRVGHGAGLSPAVTAALDEAAELVRREVSRDVSR